MSLIYTFPWIKCAYIVLFVFLDGTTHLLVCGGEGNDKQWGDRGYNSTLDTVRDTCYTYDFATDSWSLAGKMPTGPAILIGSAYSYHPAWGLVMAGGKALNFRLTEGERAKAEVVATKDGVNFEVLEPLPEPRYDHCLAILDEDTLFIAGGETKVDETATYPYSRSKQAYMYKKSEGCLHF